MKDAASTSEFYPVPDDALAEYDPVRRLPDGRIIAVHKLLHHYTLLVDLDESGYADRYCYPNYVQAVVGCMEWDGKGDPPGGWNRHPTTGRRRPDGDASREYINW